ncbi:MAG: hypothetical protein BGN88_06550 [Clostridiales bacterium 43-6]|nr:MAG: hypothetical protein BGN88_06550 [Clostridiales bacterium 43-6]
MDFISQLVDFFVHFDTAFPALIDAVGPLTYLIIFLIIFCETGLVVLPFLPGDSLLFVAGIAAAQGNALNVILVFLTVFLAAVLGNTVNYLIGLFFGERILANSKWVNQKHLDKTHKLFEKYGPQAIILSRFVPIIRTIAPFVAGIGKMSKTRYTIYNLIGGFLWSFVLVFAGYFLSGFQYVQDNQHLIIVMILVVSLLPVGIEVFRQMIWNRYKKVKTNS